MSFKHREASMINPRKRDGLRGNLALMDVQLALTWVKGPDRLYFFIKKK